MILKKFREIRPQTEKPGRFEIIDHYLYRPIATMLLLLIKGWDFSPNLISSLSVAAISVSGYFFWHMGSYQNVVWGVVWLNIGMVLDTLDGSYARYKGKGSEFGAWYDSLCDTIKFIILINAITLGFYFNGHVSTQLFFRDQAYFLEHKEIILFLGLLMLSQFFLVYFIHASRVRLSFNRDMLVSRVGDNQTVYYVGMETSIYVLFTVLLLTNQIYMFFLFWITVLPLLWAGPWYATFRNNQFQIKG